MNFDRGEIKEWEKDNDGFLRVMGTVARVGWLLYQNLDGTTRWEYATPEALFDQAHLESIAGKPLTLRHPPHRVTPENYKQYTIGTSGTKVIANQKDGLIDVLFIVADKDAIASVESGETRNLSMGYDVEREKRTDGENRFNQVKRVCNHNSLVEVGRCAGAELHLDGFSYDVSWQIGYDEPAKGQVFDLAVANLSTNKQEERWRLLTVTV